MKIALCQRTTYPGQKERNIIETEEMLKKVLTMQKGVDLVMFPEYNYGEFTQKETAYEYAETMEGAYMKAMGQLAKDYGVYLLPGSFAQQAEDGRIYNTMPLFDKTSKLLGAYRKIHLADVAGAKESDVVKPGEELVLIDTEFGKIGLMICYDMRFPEQARALAKKGADLICMCACWPVGRILPPRLNHWDTLTKATALYNLTYFAACNAYGEIKGSYPFGHSRIVNPWGDVIADASGGNGIIYGEIDLPYQRQVREEIGSFPKE
ncbi:MAG: hypothetical protein K2M46_05595 [Lachnospiraceae bacterium]|nr:hypothetical protein [Lachnospiraceae bacterium]